VVHSLRHSLRDRMREVEAPSDMIDQIGGWSLKLVFKLVYLCLIMLSYADKVFECTSFIC